MEVEDGLAGRDGDAVRVVTVASRHEVLTELVPLDPSPDGRRVHVALLVVRGDDDGEQERRDDGGAGKAEEEDDDVRQAREGRVVVVCVPLPPPAPPDVRVFVSAVEGAPPESGYVCVTVVPCVHRPPTPPVPYVNLILTAVEGDDAGGTDGTHSASWGGEGGPGRVLVSLVLDQTGRGRPRPLPLDHGQPRRRASPPPETKPKKKKKPKPVWPTPRACPRGPGMKNGDPHVNTSHPSGPPAMDGDKPGAKVSALWERDAAPLDSPDNYHLRQAMRMREAHGPTSAHSPRARVNARRLAPLNPHASSVPLARELSYTMLATPPRGGRTRATGGLGTKSRQPRGRADLAASGAEDGRLPSAAVGAAGVDAGNTPSANTPTPSAPPNAAGEGEEGSAGGGGLGGEVDASEASGTTADVPSGGGGETTPAGAGPAVRHSSDPPAAAADAPGLSLPPIPGRTSSPSSPSHLKPRRVPRTVALASPRLPAVLGEFHGVSGAVCEADDFVTDYDAAGAPVNAAVMSPERLARITRGVAPAKARNKGFDPRVARSGLFTAYGLNQLVDVPRNSDDARAAEKAAGKDQIRKKTFGFGWSFRSRRTKT